MSKLIRPCQCCGKREATMQDYRGYSGNTSRYLVCNKCFWLGDKSFKELKNSTNDKINKELCIEKQ